ncbi:NADH dehydrogenase subunit E [Planctomycetes bacterium Poly30]|uniref:NADH dehydrogenase subunit E n=2 Tax=Saltatorellus ferox TaxID=2528018 RepID=A0A518ELY8_9BACT|nr:NADH dehydrogenase subunit E [Planctomycetes bacterium Poly30]
MISLLVIAGCVGASMYLRLRTRKQDENSSPPQAVAWVAAWEKLDEETHQLDLLLEKLEVEPGASGSSGGEASYSLGDDTTIVDLEGVATLADEMAPSLEQRRAHLEAALQQKSPRADWEQDSPELVSLIEALDDIAVPASACPVDPDDLKRIRGIGKVLEGVLNEKGIHTFWQLASLGLDDIEALSKDLKHFGDRVRRDRWVEQARELAELNADPSLRR